MGVAAWHVRNDAAWVRLGKTKRTLDVPPRRRPLPAPLLRSREGRGLHRASGYSEAGGGRIVTMGKEVGGWIPRWRQGHG